MTDNSTWEQITAPSGSFFTDLKNFVDNAVFGTLSPEQQALIDQQAIDQINQAAAGNVGLATSEINQYKSDVASAVYNQLPAGVDQYIAGFEKYLPWVAGGLILLYLAPIIVRVSR